MRRRSLLGATLMLPMAGVLRAQEPYPSSMIKVIVPIGAGGIYDIIARSVSEDLSQQLSVPVVVENKPGGNYVIGMRAVSTAKPDGYTIGLSAGTILNQTTILFPNLPFKLEDYQPIAPLVSVRNILAVSGSSSIKSLDEFIQQAKASKEPMLLGTTGIGSVSHLAVVQLGKAAGFKVEAVPFSSNPATLQALMGGHVPAVAFLLASAIAQHRAGRVRILAYSGKTRHPAIPEVPTYAEAGYPELISESWAAMFAPAGTPSHIVNRLHKAIEAAIRQPKFTQMLPVDTDPFFASPAELMKIALQDRQHWQKILSDPEILKAAKPA